MWSAEAVFVCALSLLGRSEHSFPPVQFIEQPPPGVSRIAEGYELLQQKSIVLITSTWAFRLARDAQYPCTEIDALRQIASVLAHEEWHVRYGADEDGAYNAQLTALMKVGAAQTSMLFRNVMRSKQAVHEAEQRAAGAAVVAHRGDQYAASETAAPLPDRGSPY